MASKEETEKESNARSTGKKRILPVALAALAVIAAFALGFVSNSNDHFTLSWNASPWEFRQTFGRTDPGYLGELFNNGKPVAANHGATVTTPLGSYRYEMMKDQYSGGGWYPLAGAAGMTRAELDAIDWNWVRRGSR